MKFIYSLGAKYLVLSVVILAFFTMLIVATFQLTSHSQGESQKMNLAGRQRMQLFSIASHLHFLSGVFPLGVHVEVDSSAEIDRLIRQYEAVLHGLRDGDKTLQLEAIHPHDHNSRLILAGLIDRWETTQNPLLQSIIRAPRDNIRPSTCIACHDAFQANFKELDALAASIGSHHDHELHRFAQIRLVILVFAFLAAAVIGVYVRRRLIRPITAMKQAADRIKQKDFAVRLPVTGQDEISALALAINEMAATLAALYQKQEETTRRFSMLHQVGAAAAGRTLHLNAMLNEILDKIFSLELFSLQKKGGIFLYDEAKKVLTLAASRGYGPEQLRNCGTVRAGQCLCGLTAENKTVIRSTSSADHRHSLTYEGMPDHGHIILPLLLDEQLLGVLCLYLPIGRTLSAGEEESLASVADIVAVALQNSLTHRQAAMLAQALDSSRDLILITDPVGTILHANPMVVDYFGCQPKEMIGRHVLTTILSPNNPAGLDQEIFGRTMTNGWDGELLLSKRDGSEYPALLTTAPVRDAQGEIVALLSIVRDITARKQMEAESRKNEARLQRAQRIGHVGSWEWQIGGGNTLVWSEEAYRIFGLAPQDFGPTTYEGFLRCVHPADRETVTAAVDAALRTGGTYDIEHRILLPDLSEKVVHESAEVTLSSDGSPLLMSGTVHDITEHKRLEESILQANRNLGRRVAERTAELEEARLTAEAANRAKSDFLANMSHELRTPLNAIIGFSDILVDGMAGPVSDAQKDLLGDVSASGRHLLSLINDILDLSKVEAGKMELELGEVDLAELITGSLVMVKEKAMKHSLTITAEVAEGIVNIQADERKVKQVLFNLLSNAVKFTPDGGRVLVKACAWVRGQGADRRRRDREDAEALAGARNFVEISVSDSGIGISPADQEKLFQPFQQIDSSLSKQQAGTGLGLSLCRKFVELHGGRIWVESGGGGQGSRFVFVLPVTQPSEGEAHG